MDRMNPLDASFIAIENVAMLRNRTADLNGPIGPHRRWSWARSSLADVKQIRQALPGTVNDVVLAVITRGFRDLLLGRGAEVEGRVVRTLVPVSVRSEQERGTYNNRVSGMFPDLPVGIADPVERLENIRQQMDGLKESKMAVGGDSLIQMGGLRAADAAGDGDAPGRPRAAAHHQHRDHQRAGPAVPAVHAGAPDDRGLPVRADLWERADQHRDLQLPGRAQLWGDCRLAPIFFFFSGGGGWGGGFFLESPAGGGKKKTATAGGPHRKGRRQKLLPHGASPLFALAQGGRAKRVFGKR